MGVLATWDRMAGRTARAAATLGQLALIGLGTHLAADRFDDRILAGFLTVEAGLDRFITGPALHAASLFSIDPGWLIVWTDQPLAAAAAWTALAIEVSAVALLARAILLTDKDAPLSWQGWCAAFSVEAMVLPLVLTGVLIAGSWSMAMAAEDLLPPSPLAPWAAGALALAVLWRLGWPAFRRSVAALRPARKWSAGLRSAVVLAPIGLLAWMYGVPLWGWLP